MEKTLASLFQPDTLVHDDKKIGALFRESKDWILERNDDWLFSFENICEVLGFNPGYIYQRLLRWKEMKLEATN